MRAERINELASLTKVAVNVVERIRIDAAAAHITDGEAKIRALAAISALHYGGSGYFSATDDTMIVLTHPVAALIGTNSSKTPDVNGFNFIQDVTPRARRDGHASVAYAYPRPGQTTPLPKVADYRYYQPWGWFIQTGVYIDDLDTTFWASASQEFVAALVILMVLIAGSWAVIRSIVRPLGGLRRTMENLAGGDTSVVTRHIVTNDELGAMARTVGVFQENMREIQQLRSEQERMKEDAERARKGTLNRLADDFESRLGSLASILSKSSSELETTTKTMTATAERATEQAEVVAGASHEASSGVETVAAAAEELTASIGEITRQITESARMTSETAEEAQRTNGIVQILAQNAVMSVFNRLARKFSSGLFVSG